MRKFMLLAGVAALAASMPAIAKDNGRGNGNGRGAAVSAQVKGKGNARAERRQARPNVKARGQAQARADARARTQRAERRERVQRRDRRDERLDRRERRVERAVQQERREVRAARVQRERRQEALRDARQQQQRLAERRQRLIREARREDRRDWNRWVERRLAARNRFDNRLLVLRDDRPRRLAVRRDGCPPGLARQNRWCMPPGQLRKARARLIGQRLPVARIAYNIPDRYRYRFADNNRWLYRYDDDGFVYRIDRRTTIINRVVPLFGNNLMIGEPMPLGFDAYNVPLAYREYYPDTTDAFHRYHQGAIYQVDPETRLVEGIVALLTGGNGGLGSLGVGDPLPAGYDVYNVPMAYRDRYDDRDDAWYRYADGSIYQVDPQTQLIQAVISTLV